MKYCNKCGEKVVKEAKYCAGCGNPILKKSSTKNESKKDKSNKKVATIDIPIIGGTVPFIVGSESLTFREEEMLYEDMEGISCSQVYHSTNLIPTHQEFSFTFRDHEKSIQISFGTTMHIGAKNRKEVFLRLYALSKEFFVPIIVRKIVKKIFKDGETIQIGSVYLNEKGFFKKKFFGFGEDEWVYWTDSIGEPGMESGNVILYKANEDKYNHFAGIPLSSENALAVPDLVSVMHAVSRDKSILKKIIN